MKIKPQTILPSSPHKKESCKAAIQGLHTKALKDTLNSYPPNKVLQSIPPDINPEEANLSRWETCKLARLRSGYSRELNSYMSRINPEIQNKCLKCYNHLFNCYNNPTNLTVDLWTRPIQAAKFLKLNVNQ